MRRFLLLALAPLAIACADSPSGPVRTDTGSLLGLPAGGSGDGTLKLLACPTNTPTLALGGTIGLLGGTLSAGAVTLAVPEGAVLTPTLFTLGVPVSQYMEVSLGAVGVEHYVFQKPVTVTIDYSRCSQNAAPAGATLHAVYIDPGTKTILEDMGGTVNAGARTLTFTTGHFSSYAVAY